MSWAQPQLFAFIFDYLLYKPDRGHLVSQKLCSSGVSRIPTRASALSHTGIFPKQYNLWSNSQQKAHLDLLLWLEAITPLLWLLLEQ